MARRKKRAADMIAPLPQIENGWVTSETYTHNGKELTPGTMVTIRGERGARFKFLEHVVRPDGVEWLNFVGGTSGVKMFRSFRPERIGRVLKVRAA